MSVYDIKCQPDLKMMRSLHRQRFLLFNAAVFLFLPPVARFLTQKNESLARTAIYMFDGVITEIPVNLSRLYFSSVSYLISFLICCITVAFFPVLIRSRDREVELFRSKIIASNAQTHTPTGGSAEVNQRAVEMYEQALERALKISFLPRIVAFLALCCAFYLFLGILLSQIAAVLEAVNVRQLFGFVASGEQ